MPGPERYREVGEAAWQWVIAQVRDDDGPWLAEHEQQLAPPADRDSLYSGIAGLAPVLAEIRQGRPWTPDEHALAAAIQRRLTARASAQLEASLYDGIAGYAVALRLLAPGSERAMMQRLSELRTPEGWTSTLGIAEEPMSDVVLGTAGIVMTALWTGHLALAESGCEALLSVAGSTPGGLDWRMHPTYSSSSPNFSHGTAGVASALALAGSALDREDFVAAALLGARHLESVAVTDGGSFVVPHTIPPSQRDVEPLTYGWCHGPTGTSLLFSALSCAGVPDFEGFRGRCLQTVLDAGVPERLRPGFWDNDGRCCGTAGVGDVLLDAAQDGLDLLPAAVRMADALVERAVLGSRWQFLEHRQEPPELPPATGWMQGAAGICAFLLRLARVLDEGLDAPVVTRPDQWWAVPRRLAWPAQ